MGCGTHDAGAMGQTLVTCRNLVTGSQVLLASPCTRLGQMLGVQGQDKLALDTAARHAHATVKVKRRVNHQSQPQLGHHFTQSGT
jgi:plasmid maintenance system antidote protein VapI